MLLFCLEIRYFITRLKKCFCQKKVITVIINICFFEKNKIEGFENNNYQIHFHNNVIKVNVPKEVFGKEPRQWLKNIVTLWGDTRLNDDCHWHRKIAFFFIIKIWLVIFVLVFGLIVNSLAVFFAVIIGYNPKHLNYTCFKHPLTSFGERVKANRRSIIFDKNGDMPLYRLIFLPITWLFMGLLAYLFNPYTLLLAGCISVLFLIIIHLSTKFVQTIIDSANLKLKETHYTKKELTDAIKLHYKTLKYKICKPMMK